MYQSPESPEEVRSQCKLIDLNEECLYFLFSDITAKALILLVGFKVRAQPLALEFSVWVETIVYIADTCKFIEMISNIICQVVVSRILIINELYVTKYRWGCYQAPCM